jgi:hypothetical protein
MKAFEQLTVSTVVKALNPEIYIDRYEKADSATVSVRAGSVYVRMDGGLPQDGLGTLLGNGDVIELDSTNEVKFFKAIRAGSVDAVLAVDYS